METISRQWLSYELLAAKLIAYGVEISSVKLKYDDLINRRLRNKFGNKYSLWKDNLQGVPQAPNLGPLLFNIYICDLFPLVNDKDITSYADDTAPYDSGNKYSSGLNRKISKFSV